MKWLDFVIDQLHRFIKAYSEWYTEWLPNVLSCEKVLKIPDIHNDKIVIDIIPTKAAIKKIMFNVSHLFRICICFSTVYLYGVKQADICVRWTLRIRSLGFSFEDDGSLVNMSPISVSESESDNLEVPSMVHFNLFCFLKFIPLSL